MKTKSNKNKTLSGGIIILKPKTMKKTVTEEDGEKDLTPNFYPDLPLFNITNMPYCEKGEKLNEKTGKCKRNIIIYYFS